MQKLPEVPDRTTRDACAKKKKKKKKKRFSKTNKPVLFQQWQAKFKIIPAADGRPPHIVLWWHAG